MSILLSLVNRVFDLLFRPFRAGYPLLALAFFSFLTGVFMLLVYRFTSNQKEIRRAKDRMQAHVLAVRLYRDQPGVVLRSYGRILTATLRYLRLSLVPLAVMMLPLVLLLVQLDLRLSRRSPRPGEPVLLKVFVAQPDTVESVSLDLPEGLVLTAPLLRDAQDKEVLARIEPRRPGAWNIGVQLAGRVFTKQLVVSQRLEQLSSARVSPGLAGRLLEPGEEPLPEAGPLTRIEVNYPERRLELGRFELNWLVVFFILTLVAGLAVKGFLRVEF